MHHRRWKTQKALMTSASEIVLRWMWTAYNVWYYYFIIKSLMCLLPGNVAEDIFICSHCTQWWKVQQCYKLLPSEICLSLHWAGLLMWFSTFCKRKVMLAAVAMIQDQCTELSGASAHILFCAVPCHCCCLPNSKCKIRTHGYFSCLLWMTSSNSTELEFN